MRVASHISTNTGTFDGALWPLRCQSYRSPLLLCRGYRLDKKCMQQIATNSKQKNRLDACELSRCHCLPQPTLQLSRRTNHAFRRIDQGQVSFPCAMPCHANLQEPKALGETSWAHLWLAQQLQVVRPPYHPHISVPSLTTSKEKQKGEGDGRGNWWAVMCPQTRSSLILHIMLIHSLLSKCRGILVDNPSPALGPWWKHGNMYLQLTLTNACLVMIMFIMIHANLPTRAARNASWAEADLLLLRWLRIRICPRRCRFSDAESLCCFWNISSVPHTQPPCSIL